MCSQFLLIQHCYTRFPMARKEMNRQTEQVSKIRYYLDGSYIKYRFSSSDEVNTLAQSYIARVCVCSRKYMYANYTHLI